MTVSREYVELRRQVEMYRAQLLAHDEHCEPISGALHHFGEMSRVLIQVLS